MPKLRNGNNGDSNPGSLDCESGILPTELPRSTSSCGASTFPADASAAPVPSSVLALSPDVRSPTRGAATQTAAPATPAG